MTRNTMKNMIELWKKWRENNRRDMMEAVEYDAQHSFNIERIYRDNGTSYDVVTFRDEQMSTESESFEVVHKLAALREAYIARHRRMIYGKAEKV